MKNEVINISNGLSFLRLLLSIPFVIALYQDQITITVIIMIAAFLTDIGDGYFARKLNQVTELGKVIDPMADKIFVNSAIIALLIRGSAPLWFGLPVVLRDVLILLGSLVLRNKIKHVLPSDYIGKVSALVIGLCLLGIILKSGFVLNYGLYIGLIFMLVSLINYTIRMIRQLKNVE